MLQRRWWASTGNGAWTGRSLLKAVAVPGLRRTPSRGRLALLRLPARLGGARAAGRLRLADAPALAHPGVRRLLVLHAARRGRGRHRRRARARGLRHGGPRRDRARGRRHVHLAGRDRRPVGRQRARHQRPPARRGAVVPRLDGGRRRRRLAACRTGLRLRAEAARTSRRPATIPSPIPSPDTPLFSHGTGSLPSSPTVDPEVADADRRSAQRQAGKVACSRSVPTPACAS